VVLGPFLCPSNLILDWFSQKYAEKSRVLTWLRFARKATMLCCKGEASGTLAFWK
jgi:hypothetical protein